MAEPNNNCLRETGLPSRLPGREIMAQERIQKILAQAGVASRRAAERYIIEGRVRVNGKIVTELGSRADPTHDKVEVEGLGALRPEPHVYVALHKPIHVISTVRDPEGRPTVLQVLEKSRAHGPRQLESGMPRLYPVGRLDFDAEGLILLTNDGDWAQVLTHPSHHVPKTYMVKVRGLPEDKALERLRRGVRLKNPDGSLSRATAPAEVQLIKKGSSNSWLEITVFEGRYHQVKRMCDAIGHTTSRLIRTNFGGIPLDPLESGAWRFLTNAEVDQLRRWGTSKTQRDSAPTTRTTTRRDGAPTKRTTTRRDGAPTTRTTTRRDGAPTTRTTTRRDGAPTTRTTTRRDGAPTKRTTTRRDGAPTKRTTTQRDGAPTKRTTTRRDSARTKGTSRRPSPQSRR